MIRFAILSIEWWLPALILAVFLGAWEWLARMGDLSALFFPAPSTILLTLAKLTIDGPLLGNLGATLSRVVVGFLLGGVPGLIIGLVIGWLRPLRMVVDPFIASLHPIPKIAVLPLIMVLFGIGESSKLVVIAVSTFFPMVISTMNGVEQISPIHFEVAENYGASTFKLFTRVVAPGSMPMVVTGIRLALNLALLITIATELVSANSGLGTMIWLSWQTLRTEELYASLLVIAIVGILFNVVLQRLAERMLPWQETRPG